MGFSNTSFMFLTVTVYQIIKSSVPVWIILYSWMLSLLRVSPKLIAAVTTVMIGLCMSVVHDTPEGHGTEELVDSDQPLWREWLGVGLCLLAAGAAGGRNVLTQRLLHKMRLDPFSSVRTTAPLVACAIGPAFLLFEAKELMASPFMADPMLMAKTLGLVVFGGLLAFGLVASEFLIIGRTNALTMSITGISKELVIIFLSMQIFGDVLSTLNMWGFGISVLGLIAYNYVMLFCRDELEVKAKTTSTSSETVVTEEMEERIAMLDQVDDQSVSVHRRTGSDSDSEDDCSSGSPTETARRFPGASSGRGGVTTESNDESSDSDTEPARKSGFARSSSMMSLMSSAGGMSRSVSLSSLGSGLRRGLSRSTSMSTIGRLFTYGTLGDETTWSRMSRSASTASLSSIGGMVFTTPVGGLEWGTAPETMDEGDDSVDVSVNDVLGSVVSPELRQRRSLAIDVMGSPTRGDSFPEVAVHSPSALRQKVE